MLRLLKAVDAISCHDAASLADAISVEREVQPLTRPENTVKDPVTGRVRGALYTNPIDCLWKTFKTEGIAGWYKGTTAHFLRIFPHTVVTLVANEVGWVTSIEHTALTNRSS